VSFPRAGIVPFGRGWQAKLAREDVGCVETKRNDEGAQGGMLRFTMNPFNGNLRPSWGAGYDSSGNPNRQQKGQVNDLAFLFMGGSRLEPPSQLFPVISVCYIALRNRAS